ncbi:hypothetical protein NEMBOFW57_006951 [Staphylotrichum longicolle]|uniref:Uncharacterized protein n=1 Tax=Staphylotrichum longicolle TaxID=669026 RepID=A0AAD4EU84_9PEZI|nr:hypothetical protein NEMBOFW57_006951 [Staphylotrichum longicolle]
MATREAIQPYTRIFKTPEATSSPRVLLLHLNALLSCRDATTRTIHRTIAEVLHANDIPELSDEAILLAFSKSPRVVEIISHLGIRDLSIDEHRRLLECYPRIFARDGFPLVYLAPHASEFLENAKRLGILIAVMSNNTTTATTLLENLGVAHLVDKILPTSTAQVYPPTPHAVALFDQTWHDAILPWFISTTNCNGSHKRDMKLLVPQQAMVVSCALYDLEVPRLSGMQTCWINTIHGESEEDATAVHSSRVFDHVVVLELEELGVKLFGELHAGGEDEVKSEKSEEAIAPSDFDEEKGVEIEDPVKDEVLAVSRDRDYGWEGGWSL